MIWPTCKKPDTDDHLPYVTRALKAWLNVRWEGVESHEMSNMIAATEALELHHWVTYLLVTTSQPDPPGLPISCNLIVGLRERRPGKPPTSHNYLRGRGSALQTAMALHRKADSGADGVSTTGYIWARPSLAWVRALCALMSKPKHSTLHSPHRPFII